jgi:hypothetical protein
MDHFNYIVTDADGNRGQADIYIRLSDDAPPFPNPAPETHSESVEGLAAPMAFSGMATLLNFDEEEDPFAGTAPDATAQAGVELPENGELSVTLGELLPPDSAADSLDTLLPVSTPAEDAPEVMDMETLIQTLSQPPSDAADSTDAAAAQANAADLSVAYEPDSASAEQAMAELLIKNING